MQEKGKAAQYFISANTPQGFLTRIDRLYSGKNGWAAYILKGGPGTGKSFVIKKAGDAALAMGLDVEFLRCTSDCSLYDGVVIPALKACVLDGTYPHAIEPRYPGAVESIVNLGDCWDENRLASEREKIVLFAARIDALYSRAYRLLGAAGQMLEDTFRLAQECADMGKIDRYSLRIAKREFAPKRRQGKESVRFLSGVTPDGVIFFSDTVSAYNKIFILEDDAGLGSFLLSRLKNYALAAGYDVISCYCPMAPEERLEHLLIPGLSLAFVTSNRFHKFEGRGRRHIHIRRFMDETALKAHHQRIVFNRKASRELTAEAVRLFGDARANYAMLKSIYSSAMDFGRVEEIADGLVGKLKSRKHG